MRLVDVVLILLFGFISISSTKGTRIDRLTSSETSLLPVETQETLYVGVTGEGDYLVENEQVSLAQPGDVQSYLIRQQARSDEQGIKVRIRASRRATARSVFLLAAMCDSLGIPKALEVEVRHQDED